MPQKLDYLKILFRITTVKIFEIENICVPTAIVYGVMVKVAETSMSGLGSCCRLSVATSMSGWKDDG